MNNTPLAASLWGEKDESCKFSFANPEQPKGNFVVLFLLNLKRLILFFFSLCPTVALGRNQPLKKEKPKWKSDYPMTDGQLRSKRDEFWDTAPAFEGRKEIWDALKAAAHAFESNDHELAQAIIDGANITLPHGRCSSARRTLQKGDRVKLMVFLP